MSGEVRKDFNHTLSAQQPHTATSLVPVSFFLNIPTLKRSSFFCSISRVSYFCIPTCSHPFQGDHQKRLCCQATQPKKVINRS